MELNILLAYNENVASLKYATLPKSCIFGSVAVLTCG